MISLVSNMHDGSQAEVGIIGHEGVLGVSLLSGIDTPFIEAMVQLPGSALRMKARNFVREVDTNAVFRKLMFRYSEALQSQIMQTAACNGRHDLEQRFARWLLMAYDRAGEQDLPLTQEFMSMMLGVQRSSISGVASVLNKAGAIKYASGRLTVRSRTLLESSSCECYEVVRRRFEFLLG
jgi:CRP-like cAMP-binding protein